MSLKNKWLITLGWIVCIYVSLPFVRPVAEFLRARNLLRLTIAVIFLSFVFAFGLWLKKNFKNISPKIWMYIVIVFGMYIFAITHIPLPEEQVHLVQYGVLVFLVFQALRERFQAPQAYLLSFVFTSLAGWADEGIQYLLPNRYYELRDVGLNCLSAALGMGIIFIVNQIKKNEKTD